MSNQSNRIDGWGNVLWILFGIVAVHWVVNFYATGNWWFP